MRGAAFPMRGAAFPMRGAAFALALIACLHAARANADNAAPPKAQAPAGTRAVVVESQAMDAIIGKTIKSTTGDNLGRLIDVLVDPLGDIRAAVIDFGGVFGVGSRAIAVDWRALDFSESAKTGVITLTLTRNQIRVAPIYRAGEPVVIMEPSKPAKPETDIKPEAAGKPEASSAPTPPPAANTTPPAPASPVPK
jgi:hypothetical protein